MVYFSLYMIPWIGVMQINETLVVSCCLVSYQQFFSISDCSSNLLCFSKCSLEVNEGNNFHSFGPTMCSSLCLHVWDGIEANLLQAILLLTAAHWSYHSFGLNGTDILTPFPCVMSLIMTLILNLSLIVYCVSFIYWTLSYSPCCVHLGLKTAAMPAVRNMFCSNNIHERIVASTAVGIHGLIYGRFGIGNEAIGPHSLVRFVSYWHLL